MTADNSNAAPKTSPPAPADDASTNTLQTGFSPRSEGDKEAELVIKVTMDHSTANAATKFAAAHSSLLKAFLESNHNVELWDNHGTKVSKVPFTWATDFNQHAKSFNVNVIKRREDKRTSIVVHRIRTTATFSTLARTPAIADILQEGKLNLTRHHWNESVWDTGRPGWIIGINPGHYSPDEATKVFMHKLPAEGQSMFPKFKLVPTNQRIGDKATGKSTRAYTLEVQRKDYGKTLRAVKKFFRKDPVVILSRLRYDHPDAFRAAIAGQNRHLKENMVIQVDRLESDQYWDIHEAVCKLDDVIDFIPTAKSQTHGRYNIIVAQPNFSKVLNQLHSIWDKIMSNVKEEHTTSKFGIPHLRQDKFDRDDDSSGMESYLSISASSILTFFTDGTTTSETEPLIPEQPPPEIITNATPTLPSTSQVTQSTDADRRAEQAEIRAAEAEKRAADAEAEVRKLRDEITQVHSKMDTILSRLPPPSTPPQLSTQEDMTDDQHSPSDSLSKQLFPADPPPSKRQDQKPTPTKPPRSPNQVATTSTQNDPDL